jgi:MoxR-like ATPase
MRHDPRTARLAEFEVKLMRDERAHIAETHRFLLRRGHELIDLSSRAGGAAAVEEAVSFRAELLWQEGAAEGTLIADMADRLASLTALSASDRDLRDDLLRALRKLAGSAEGLRQRRALAARRESHCPPGAVA